MPVGTIKTKYTEESIQTTRIQKHNNKNNIQEAVTDEFKKVQKEEFSAAFQKLYDSAKACIRGVAEKKCDWQRCARTDNAATSPFT
jgi:hypothetical protein